MSMDKYTGSNEIRLYPLASNQVENQCFRFLDKDNNTCERQLISNAIREQMNLYGTKVTYFVNTYNPSLSNENFYGEQPLAPFGIPINFIAYIELNENSLLLTKYGFQSEDEITMYIHISSFYEAYNTPNLSAYFHNYAIEPKSGDVFKLTEYGSDRPGERDGKMFEITERLDQDINKINPLMGHYVWLLKAKRFEYSFEPGLSAAVEKGNYQIFDDKKDEEAEGATKNYPIDVDQFSKDNVYSGFTNNDVYGGYDDYILSNNNVSPAQVSPEPLPQPTPTPTQTSTNTLTPTPTITRTITPTQTPSQTPTNTLTPTQTNTPTQTPSPTSVYDYSLTCAPGVPVDVAGVTLFSTTYSDTIKFDGADPGGTSATMSIFVGGNFRSTVDFSVGITGRLGQPFIYIAQGIPGTFSGAFTNGVVNF
jgi:hypothetical protein